MPSLLSRLRSLASKRSISHSSSAATEYADQTAGSTQHAISPDAFYSPRTPDFALDSKIAPDISALLASVEEDAMVVHNDVTEDGYDDAADVYYEGRERFVHGLKPRPPVAGSSKDVLGELQGKGSESRGKGSDTISDTISSADGVPPSSSPYNSQKRWSTFGREGKRVIPSMRSFVRTQSSRKEVSDAARSDVTMSLASQSQSQLERHSDNKTLSSGTTASRPSTVVTGTQRTTSTFGRPPIPSRPTTGVSTTRTPSRQSSGRLSVRDNVHNPDGNALLSWSPPAEIIADEQSIFDNSSSSSHTDSAQAPSPEVHEVEEQNVVNSPSPRTFGHPTPHHQQPHIMATTVPFPPFQSTPLSTPTHPAQPSDQGNQQNTLFRFADSSLSPISTTLGRAFRSNSERSNTAKTVRSTGNLRDRRPSRSQTTLRSQKRRRSAVWSAEAASVGVVAGLAQDFGWPADVSREMLRLSLGEEVAYTTQEAVQRQEAGKTVQDTRNRALSAPIYLPNNLPVAETWQASDSSHELLTATSRQDKHGLMRAGSQGSSSHPISSISFPFPSSSSSPTSPTLIYPSGLAEPIKLGNLARDHLVQIPKDSVRRQLRELDDKTANVNDVDSEGVQQSGGGEDQMIQHVRSDSEDQIRWDSRRLQEYLASSGGGEKSVDFAVLRPSTPIMKTDSASTYQTAASSSLLQPPSLSVQAPTPQGSPGHSRQESSPETEGENLQVPNTTSTPEASEKSKGKRKAEESEGESPPGLKIGKKTTFATPLGGRGPPRVSDSSHAPSSFMSRQSSRKRVRLSSPMPTPDHSRPGSSTNAPAFNSVSSRGSSRSFINSALSHSKSVGPSMPSPTASSPPRPSSRASRAKSMSAASTSAGGRMPNRRSFSQASIPISAIVSPRAPTISNHSSFHMRDPRKPPRKRPVGWRLRLKTFEDDGSPFPAWAFWFGFFMPVLWFIASFWRMPRTRTVGTDIEKAIVVDDPQIEREARAWRLRCRIASGIFFFTYVPVIVLIAVFATRS